MCRLTAVPPLRRRDPKVRRQMSGPAMRSFFNVAELWQLYFDMEFSCFDVKGNPIDICDRRNELESMYGHRRLPGAIRAAGSRLDLPPGYRFFLRSTAATPRTRQTP